MKTGIVGIALTVMLSLVGDLEDGLQHLQEKEYDKAVTSFTKVIEAEDDAEELRELALEYRSQAYLEDDHKDKALEDLAVLIRKSENGSRRERAVAMYTEAGGDLKHIRPEDDPETVMQNMLAAIRKGDEKEARTYISGGLEQLLESMDAVFQRHMQGKSYLMEAGKEMGNMNASKQSIADKNQTATLTTTAEFGTLTFGLDQMDGEWKLTSLQQFVPRQQPHVAHHQAAPQQPNVNDTNKLRQLDSAIEQYAMENNAMPSQLADVADYIKDFANTRISSVDGEPFVFAEPKDGDKAWVFRATAKNGKRLGLIDGSIITVSEDQFQKLAKEQGIKVPQQWDDVELGEKETKEIEALIEQLGADNFQKRKAAYKQLKAMGAKAGKLLDKATDNPDPEIAVQSRKLLSEM